MASTTDTRGIAFLSAASRQEARFSPTHLLLCLYLLLFFLRPHEYLPGLAALRLPLVVGALCVVSHVFESLSRARPFVLLSPAAKTLGLLTVWMLVGLPFAFWKAGAFDTIVNQWTKMLVLFVLLSTGVTSLKAMQRLLWVCTACVVLVSLLAMADYNPAAVSEDTTRLSAQVGGPYSGANYFSLTILAFLPFAGFLALFGPNWPERLLAGAASAILVAANVLTQSRAGTLGLLLILAVLVWKGRHLTRRRLAPLVVLGLGLVVFVLQAPEIYWERLSTLVQDPTREELDDSAYLRAAVDSEQERSELLRKAVILTLENPILGVGAGNFMAASAERWNAGSGRDWLASHNTYLQFSAELGLPGLALYLWLLGQLFRGLRQVRKQILAVSPPDRSALVLCEVLATALLVYVLLSAFASVAYDPYFFLIAGLAVALPQTLRGQRRASLPAAPVLDGKGAS